jgi:hypothetical protein
LFFTEKRSKKASVNLDVLIIKFQPEIKNANGGGFNWTKGSSGNHYCYRDCGFYYCPQKTLIFIYGKNSK